MTAHGLPWLGPCWGSGGGRLLQNQNETCYRTARLRSELRANVSSQKKKGTQKKSFHFVKIRLSFSDASLVSVSTACYQ